MTGACEAGKGAASGVQQPLHGEPGGQLQGQRLPVHAVGVHHGGRALHIHAGQSPPLHQSQICITVNPKDCCVATRCPDGESRVDPVCV